MPGHTSHASSNEPFDLTDIFIGREQQLDLFEAYLNRWKELMPDARLDDPLTMSVPSPNNKIQGLVVLIYGRGGIGKSSLLRRYRNIALRDSQNPRMSQTLISTIVDWEFSVEGKRGVFNPLQGQEIDAFAYFQLLCSQLAIALKNKPLKGFRKYHEAEKVVEKARKEASEVLGNMQANDRYAKLRTISVDVVLTLLSTVAPPPVGKLLGMDNVKEAASEGMEIASELLTQVKQTLQERLGSRLDDLLDPALCLGRALGRDLYEFARDFPLLIFFDTYEEIDEGDQLLRMVMGAAGPRVGWVIAGRDNLWGGAEQRKRSIAKEYGYKDVVFVGRGLAVDFNAGGKGPFTLSDIKNYFDQLCEGVHYEPPLPNVNEDDARQILKVTKGVPLAVAIAAGLYLETANLKLVTESPDSKRQIVDEMVERYLLHAHDDQAERGKLYGLALLRRPDLPLAVSSALNLTPEQAETSYESELSRLQHRYSFIFTGKEQPSLHQEVRHFVRQWLLEHIRDLEIVAINKRLKEAHEAELIKLENRFHHSSLDERLQDEEWAEVYLDLIEQEFWLDPVEGVLCALPFMVAAIHRRPLSREVYRLGEFFKQKLRPPYSGWWASATKALVYYTSSRPYRNELEELTKLANQNKVIFPQILLPYRDELEAMLWWRLAEVYKDNNSNKALDWYEKALSRLGQDVKLRESVVKLYWDMAVKFQSEKKYTEIIPLLDRALELKPDYVQAYYSRGNAYSSLKEYQRAITDFDHALELDPGSAWIRAQRGVTYRYLKEYQRAIADLDHALELDSKLAWAYSERGITYHHLKECHQAIADLNRANELNPSDTVIHTNLGLAYYDCNQYERAIEEYTRALELNPRDANIYKNRGFIYRNMKAYELAIQDYDHALELDPNHAPVYANRGEVYRLRKENERAIQDFDQAIKLSPNYAWAYSSRGKTYLSQNEYQRAIQDFDQAIKLSPNYVWVYSSRGMAYLWLKNIQKAKTDYSRCYELDPTNVEAAWMSEWASMSKSRLSPERAELISRIVTIDAQHYLSYICRGVALGLRGKVREGLGEVEKAIQLSLDEPDAHFWKGMLSAYYYQEGSHREELVAVLEQSLALGLPPILLTPLYWLEEHRLDFFNQYAKPLLEKYGV